ncbi:Holliday junction recognition protein [Suncus etruscus]|uniref:Holliday junction recognition protein n=1 Tax=Suncus etruscus TaxID=109475 RepID=UPI00210FF74C|nr:Holliday junction recognition protein [Suncus etruscus]
MAEARARLALKRRLRASCCRFQKRMQHLIAKYDQAFEDSPLVQMSTLTYETPQGLKVWGGKLVKDKNRRQLQDSPQKAKGLSEQIEEQGAAEGSHAGVEAESRDAEATHLQKSLTALEPSPLQLVVPGSPLKNELRRKYLAQVEVLLEDQKKHIQSTDHSEDADTWGTCDPVLISFFRPPQAHCGSISEGHSSALVPLPTTKECLSPPPCPTNSTSMQAAEGASILSSPSLEDTDLSEVTISDLYAGMLHTMSQLLSSRPSCIISTKTSILQNWKPRRRARMNRTYYTATRALDQSPQDTCQHSSGSRQRFLQQTPRLRVGLSPEKGVLSMSPKHQGRDTDWKGLRGTPHKRASTDFSIWYGEEQENRLLESECLVSPLKMVTKIQELTEPRSTHCREIGNRFTKLHQEYCSQAWTQPSRGTSWALDTHFQDAQAKRFRDALRSSVGATSCLLPALPSSSSPSHDAAPQNPGPLLQASQLPLVLSPRASQMVTSPSPVRSPMCTVRYREISKSFDKFYQQFYSRTLPGDLHSSFQSPSKLSSPCLPQAATAGSRLPAWCLQVARRDSEFTIKRRRLSAPPLCGPGDSCRALSPATPQLIEDDQQKVRLYIGARLGSEPG